MKRLTHHPVVIAHLHPKDWEVRLSDAITRFVGSMPFVYIHLIAFTTWVVTDGFGYDSFPFNFLTMAVSLEAILLTSFVLIGQNRQGQFAEAKADHDFQTIHQKIADIHRHLGLGTKEDDGPATAT